MLCPRVHRDNYGLACGGHAWCALLVVRLPDGQTTLFFLHKKICKKIKNHIYMYIYYALACCSLLVVRY